MSSRIIEVCPICDQDMVETEQSGRIIRDMRGREGLVVEIGYSRGGWGNPKNRVQFSNMVCSPCFERFLGLVEPAVEFLRNGPKEELKIPAPEKKDPMLEFFRRMLRRT